MHPITVIHCCPHPHIGETLTTNYLRYHLPQGIILVNYYLPNPPGTLEIDLVVLNHNGVYLIEVKHWYGIYHRNLSPHSVYLCPKGVAKLGDFDFAKVPTISRTLSQTTQNLMTGRHLAPEQILQVHDVDQRADIFSLGALWYDMLFRPAPDARLDRSQIANAPLPDQAKKLLAAMLSERRINRPTSIHQVRKQLKER